jgi:exosortase/archaeosortase family protein
MKGNKPKLSPALIFVIKFLGLFAFIYGFYVLYLAMISSGGKLYAVFFDKHLNFISGLRYVLIESSAAILNILGYETRTNVYQMLVVGHNLVHVGYDCLGFGVMSFFTAFVIAYPGLLKTKLYFWGIGLLVIQLLNLSRFVILSIYWRPTKNVYISDHHTIFNIIVYMIIAISLYYYTRYQDKAIFVNAKN